MAGPSDLRRDRYMGDSIATASPARLLVMLYDRLLLDLESAEVAERTGDALVAAARLRHAQEILLELRASLDVEVWSGGPALASLYSWMLTELIRAGVDGGTERIVGVRDAVEPLADAWRQAATMAASAPTRASA